jgi:hypothetical protein
MQATLRGIALTTTVVLSVIPEAQAATKNR